MSTYFSLIINNRIIFTCFHFLNILFNKWNLFYQYTSGNIILTIKHVCTQPRIITYASTIIKEAIQNIYSTVKWHYTEKKINRDNIFYTFKSCYICYTACRIHLSYYSNPIGFYVKTMSAHSSHLGWMSWSPDTILKVYYPRTIHAMFALNWLTYSKGPW